MRTLERGLGGSKKAHERNNYYTLRIPLKIEIQPKIPYALQWPSALQMLWLGGFESKPQWCWEIYTILRGWHLVSPAQNHNFARPHPTPRFFGTPSSIKIFFGVFRFFRSKTGPPLAILKQYWQYYWYCSILWYTKRLERERGRGWFWHCLICLGLVVR